MKGTNSMFSFVFARPSIFFVAFLVFGLVYGSGYASEKEMHGGQVVQVELDEWHMLLDKQIVSPGKVTFRAMNKGTVEHEMVVIKTDFPADRFQVTNGKVKEDTLGEVIGEIEGFASETNEMLSLTLSRGSYVLFCNNLKKGQAEGHYQKGMRVNFTVR